MKRLLMLLPLLAGCYNGADRPGVVIVDSAGVRVVANGPLPALAVQIDQEPVMRVGWDSEDVQFADITAGTFLSDNSVVVFDGVTDTLHILSPEGSEVAHAGGKGDGPGEFQSGEAIEALAGDTIVVFDPWALRLSLFDREGGFLESGPWVPPFTRLSMRLSGVTASGRWLWITYGVAPSPDSMSGTYWVNAPLLTSSRLGRQPDTVAWLPFAQIQWSKSRPVFDPFNPYARVDAYAGGFVWGRNDVNELRWLDESGAVRQIARWDMEAIQPTDAVWARYDQAYRDRMASIPRGPSDERIAQVLAERRSIASATVPYFSLLQADPEGNVWVSEWAPFQGPTRLFYVFDKDGTFTRRVEFARPIQVLAVGRGVLLGIERDDLDVQAVVVYSIPR